MGCVCCVCAVGSDIGNDAGLVAKHQVGALPGPAFCRLAQIMLVAGSKVTGSRGYNSCYPLQGLAIYT